MTGSPEEGPASPQDNPPIAAPVLPECPPGSECAKEEAKRLGLLGLELSSYDLCIRPDKAETVRAWTSERLSDTGVVDLSILYTSNTVDNPSDNYDAYGLTVIPRDVDSERTGIQLPTSSDGAVAFEVAVAAGAEPAFIHLQVEGRIKGEGVKAAANFMVRPCNQALSVSQPGLRQLHPTHQPWHLPRLPAYVKP